MKKRQLFYGIIAVFILSGCKKKEDSIVSLPPPITNSPELITSMELQLRDSSNTNNLIIAKYRDPDGPGGNPALQFDSVKLQINKTYFVDILLLDETKNPIDTISKSVQSEGDEHQFFFQHTNIYSTYLDTDSRGNPIGLKSKWKTYNAGTGTSKITLKHQTDGTKNGSINTGETDIEITFLNKIQ